MDPMKMYKTKKVMRNRIAQDLKEILNGLVCNVKTNIKRKKKSVDNNSKSGSSRMEIEYKEELKKISAADDSIQPEILRLKKIKNNQAFKSCNIKISNTEVKRKVKKSLQDILYDINERKEAAKERRHKEKLKLLKELYKKGCKNQENNSEENHNQENEN